VHHAGVTAHVRQPDRWGIHKVKRREKHVTQEDGRGEREMKEQATIDTSS